jgi:hypothetical protein
MAASAFAARLEPSADNQSCGAVVTLPGCAGRPRSLARRRARPGPLDCYLTYRRRRSLVVHSENAKTRRRAAGFRDGARGTRTPDLLGAMTARPRNAHSQGFSGYSFAADGRRIALDYRRLWGFQALAAFQCLGPSAWRDPVPRRSLSHFSSVELASPARLPAAYHRCGQGAHTGRSRAVGGAGEIAPPRRWHSRGHGPRSVNSMDISDGRSRWCCDPLVDGVADRLQGGCTSAAWRLLRMQRDACGGPEGQPCVRPMHWRCLS